MAFLIGLTILPKVATIHKIIKTAVTFEILDEKVEIGMKKFIRPMFILLLKKHFGLSQLGKKFAAKNCSF